MTRPDPSQLTGAALRRYLKGISPARSSSRSTYTTPQVVLDEHRRQSSELPTPARRDVTFANANDTGRIGEARKAELLKLGVAAMAKEDITFESPHAPAADRFASIGAARRAELLKLAGLKN